MGKSSEIQGRKRFPKNLETASSFSRCTVTEPPDIIKYCMNPGSVLLAGRLIFHGSHAEQRRREEKRFTKMTGETRPALVIQLDALLFIQ